MSPELANALYRAAHSIKGGARLLDLRDVAGAAESLEGTIAAIRDGRAPAGRESAATLLAATQQITELIWPDAGAPAVPTAPTRQEPTLTSTTVRVPTNRIDALVALVSEARRAQRIGRDDVPELLAATELAAMRLRLMPLEGVFADLRLAVHNAARDDGKEALLQARGGEVEADGAVVDAAAEIVLQLVRNAVAHGIETPAERQVAGKDPTGHIDVSVHARGGVLEIVVSDDGRGVDENAVRARANALGLDTGEPVEELLFAPGLSTRDQRDALGGAGVGLDVVRARARGADGDVTVAWHRGRGSTWTVRLPVSALLERLAVAHIGSTLIGVPVDAVESIRAGQASGGLMVEGPVDEVSALTVPLGPLFASSKLFRRAWIAPDGQVGVVLESLALQVE